MQLATHSQGVASHCRPHPNIRSVACSRLPAAGAKLSSRQQQQSTPLRAAADPAKYGSNERVLDVLQLLKEVSKQVANGLA